jgi:hypothetical protein
MHVYVDGEQVLCLKWCSSTAGICTFEGFRGKRPLPFGYGRRTINLKCAFAVLPLTRTDWSRPGMAELEIVRADDVME